MTTWPVREIRLAAYYLSNHNEDVAVIPCQYVSLVPEECKLKVGADGSVSRSITKPSSLLLEGAEASSVHSLGWQPQTASFTDKDTGNEHNFNIRSVQADSLGKVVLLLGG
jgi:hypothetical protein